jgi:hypothetical protein
VSGKFGVIHIAPLSKKMLEVDGSHRHELGFKRQ